MHLGTAFVISGIVQFIVAWLYFRQPGQKFWVIAPIWRASQFLSPAGVALWVGGVILMAVGVLSMVLESH